MRIAIKAPMQDMIHVVPERVIMVVILYLVVINVKTGLQVLIAALLIGRWTY